MILKIILKKECLKLQATSFKQQAARPGGPSKIMKKRFDNAVG